MNYYLIGLPASGKSSVGKALATKIEYEFYDLDRLIEKNEGITIPNIFKLYGEDYFRDLETKYLKELKEKDNIVVSCGGGIVLRKENKEYMNGIIVLLKTNLKEIEFRLKRDNNQRPISKEKDIYTLYKERASNYEYFKTFSIKSQIISKTVNEIIKEAKKYGKKKGFSD
jgi:shikimate kinase